MITAKDLVAVMRPRLQKSRVATAAEVAVIDEIDIETHGSSEVEGGQLKMHRLFFFSFLFFNDDKSLSCVDGKCLREHAKTALMGFFSQ